MSLTARVIVNKRDIAEFEKFMTGSLQKEIENAYARALNRLGKGCVAWIKKELRKSQDPEDAELLAAGIVSSPGKVKNIMKLNPLRIAIGAGSMRNRYFTSETLVGQPFRVTLTNINGSKVSVIAQRTKQTKRVHMDDATSVKSYKGRKWTSHQSFDGYLYTALPITVIANLKDSQIDTFKSMVNIYVAHNHDKFIKQEFEKAVEREAKK